MNTNASAPKKESRSLSYLLIALLFISVVFNVYQWRNHSTTVVSYDNRIDSMIVVRVEVEKELASTNVELEKYRGISANLDSLLNDANDKIGMQEKKIRTLIAKEKDASKLSKRLKEELADLQKLRDEYLEKIDQLVTENKELKAKNEELTTTVTSLSAEKETLQGKVTTASQLKAEYVKVHSYKKKSNGKYVESSLAKRTNKLEVCFTIMDNKVAEPGDKMVYVVITEPTGKVLAGQSKTTFMSAQNTEMAATASYKMNYTGEKQDNCLNYESDQRELTPGKYNVDIYIDGTLTSSSQYMLE